MIQKPFRLAFLCGSTALGMGTFIFLGWKLTRSPLFPMFGPLVLIAGFFMVVLGLVGLTVEWYKNQDDARYIIKTAAIPLALLLANFPVAIFYATEGIADLDTVIGS